jgi:hypothetical protein
MWHVPKMWEDGECWIIGGGSSMPRQFNIPENVIKNVMSGKFQSSAYLKYLDFLKDKHTIGINNAYQLGGLIDILFYGDNGWFRKHKKDVEKRKLLTVTCATAANTEEMKRYGVKIMGRCFKPKYGISIDYGKVIWNYNSGAASISLATQLGVKKIYLLGFDMKCDGGNKTHWHKPHTKGKIPPFEKHLRGFFEIAKDAERLGVEIINVNPDSAIDVFPKISLDEII